MLLPTFCAIAIMAAPGFCASLQQVSDFGSNPTSIDMYIYVPDKVATKPPIIVGVSDEPTQA